MVGRTHPGLKSDSHVARFIYPFCQVTQHGITYGGEESAEARTMVHPAHVPSPSPASDGGGDESVTVVDLPAIQACYISVVTTFCQAYY